MKRPAPQQDTDAGWLLNLHDVFLNASLMHRLLQEAPLPTEADEFPVSDFGRLERCWHRDLYVLVEAWQRTPAERHVEWRTWATEAHNALMELLDRAEIGQLVEQLRMTRDYMSHRDAQRYWSPGRWATAIVGYDAPLELHRAFGRFFLEAMRGKRQV